MDDCVFAMIALASICLKPRFNIDELRSFEQAEARCHHRA
jgi:hypothetical protein